MTMTWVPVESIKALKRYLSQQRKLYHEYALNVDPKRLVREFKAALRHLPKHLRRKGLMLLTLSLEEHEVLTRDQCELLPHLFLREMSHFASVTGPEGALESCNCELLKSWWPWHGDTGNIHTQAVLAMIEPLTGKFVSVNAKNKYRDVTAMHAVTRAVERQMQLHCHENNPKPEIMRDRATGLYWAKLPDDYQRKSELTQTEAKVLAHRGRSVAEKLAELLARLSLDEIKSEAKVRDIDSWERLGELLRQNNACLRAWGRGYSYVLNGHAVSASELTRHRPELEQWKYTELVKTFGQTAGWEVLGVSVEEQKMAFAKRNSVAVRLPSVLRQMQERERDSVLFVVERSLRRLPADEAYIQVTDSDGCIRHKCKVQLVDVHEKSPELLRWESEGRDISVWPIAPEGLSFIARYQLTAAQKDRLVADFPPSVVMRDGSNDYSVLFVAKNPSHELVKNKTAARLLSLEFGRHYGGASEPQRGIGFAVAGLARTASDGFVPRLLFATHAISPTITNALEQAHQKALKREREFWRGAPGEALRILERLKTSEDEQAFSLETEFYTAHLEKIAEAAEVCLTVADRDERVASGLMRAGKTRTEVEKILGSAARLATAPEEVQDWTKHIERCVKVAATQVAEHGVSPELQTMHKAVERKHASQLKARSKTHRRAETGQEEQSHSTTKSVTPEPLLATIGTDEEERERKKRQEEFDRRRKEAYEAEQAVMDTEWILADNLILGTHPDEREHHRSQYQGWLSGESSIPGLMEPLLDIDQQEAIQAGKARTAIIATLDEEAIRALQEFLDAVASNHDHTDKLLHHAIQLERDVRAGKMLSAHALTLQADYARHLHVCEGMPRSGQPSNRGKEQQR